MDLRKGVNRVSLDPRGVPGSHCHHENARGILRHASGFLVVVASSHVVTAIAEFVSRLPVPS